MDIMTGHMNIFDIDNNNVDIVGAEQSRAEVNIPRQKKLKCEIYRDSMQNYKKYAIRPAQLIIADVPYNVGNNF